ncbi:MAG: GGDEF domain-containing protein [Firmicutes bacterium]|nr:GGDEF domain-containing protein [Bacillota bacterium]
MIDSSGRVQRFASAEGVISEDVNAMAILPEANGDVWFGTGGGLVQFLSSMYRGFPKPPYTALLDCKLGDTSYPIQTHMPKVPKADGTFRAQFAGLTYIQEGSIAYQVRLEGLDADWRPSETREERYASLSAGKYRFDVRSRIGEGDWGPISSFEFEVLPAWWETWWFRLLALLGGAGLITILSRWRMSHLRHRNERLRAIVALRTREVEAKAEELLVANEALRNQSLTDPLTGLRNRRYLWVCLPEDVAQVKRVNHSLATDAVDRLLLNVDLAFFMVDIDYFKDVNDNHGHMAGDRVLQQVGEILKRVTRDTDTVVRWGGEEFLVVARNTARREATVLAERIRSEIERHVFTLGEGSKLYRCCSIGFSFYPFMPNQPNLFTWEQCLEIADRCLYAAKRGGRNAWVGLAASQDADVEGLKHSVPVNIPRALQSGDVEVVTSISDDVTLQWGEPR